MDKFIGIQNWMPGSGGDRSGLLLEPAEWIQFKKGASGVEWHARLSSFAP
jgi:hypothetical protein